MLNIENLTSKHNPDLVKERENGNVDIAKLKLFFGNFLFGSYEKNRIMSDLS